MPPRMINIDTDLALSRTKDQRAFWDAAVIGALAASGGGGAAKEAAGYAADIADYLLIERNTRRDNGEI